MTRKPNPLNVLGPFYVEDGCCLACGIPEHYAPDLFASVETHEQCFVKKQPGSPAQLEQMLEVLRCQELDCIRYRGQDPRIRQTLIQEGLSDYVDD